MPPKRHLLALGLCAAVASAASSLSIRQPELDAETWFLTADELLASTGGFDRTAEVGIAAWTSGNEAVPLIEGRNMFMKARVDVRSRELRRHGS